jgi:hypothetical protein
MEGIGGHSSAPLAILGERTSGRLGDKGRKDGAGKEFKGEREKLVDEPWISLSMPRLFFPGLTMECRGLRFWRQLEQVLPTSVGASTLWQLRTEHIDSVSSIASAAMSKDDSLGRRLETESTCFSSTCIR